MNKENLFNRVADISNSMFPLVDFFNDIEQIKDEDYNKEKAYEDIEKICDIVEQLLEDSKRKEKLEKVWEIAAKKGVDLLLLIDCPNVAQYNKAMEYRSNIYIYLTRALTETEFNLLKEMLG